MTKYDDAGNFSIEMLVEVTKMAIVMPGTRFPIVELKILLPVIPCSRRVASKKTKLSNATGWCTWDDASVFAE